VKPKDMVDVDPEQYGSCLNIDESMLFEARRRKKKLKAFDALSIAWNHPTFALNSVLEGTLGYMLYVSSTREKEDARQGKFSGARYSYIVDFCTRGLYILRSTSEDADDTEWALVPLLRALKDDIFTVSARFSTLTNLDLFKFRIEDQAHQRDTKLLQKRYKTLKQLGILSNVQKVLKDSQHYQSLFRTEQERNQGVQSM
jgi:hypothetical protein